MPTRYIIFITFIVYACASKKTITNYSQIILQYREIYKNDFIENPRSPLIKEDLPYLDFFPVDENWRLKCSCHLVKDAKPFELPTYSGVTRTYIHHSTAKCIYKKQYLTLSLYKNIHQPVNPLYKNHLFLPFKDESNGDTTYGGGRYLNLMDTDIIDGIIEIDFNKSYNPWCAYSDGFNCPIPPKDNHLPLEILAGEKEYKGKYKKKDS